MAMICLRTFMFVLFACSLALPPALLSQPYQRVMLSIPPDSGASASHRYGSSTAIIGNTVMAGAPYESYDENGSNFLNRAGAVYVLEADPARRWQHIQKFTAPQRGAGSWFGVSMEMEENRAIIGEPGYIIDPWTHIHGKAHIFEKNGTGQWEIVQTLIGSNRSQSDNFAYHVALGGDRALVSVHGKDYQWGPGPNDIANANGGAYLFEQDSSGNWQEAAFFFVPDTSDENWFGHSLDIEGEVALISAPFEDEDEQGLNYAIDAGAVYVFEPDSSGSWNLKQSLVAPAQDRFYAQHFGYEVCINQGQLLIGARGSRMNSHEVGNIYVYEKDSSSQWVLVQKIFASDASDLDRFGEKLSAQDDLLIVGAPGVNGNLGPNVGAVYIFEKDAAGQWQEVQKIIDPYGPANYELGRNTVDIYENSAIMTKVDSGVIHYEVCEAQNQVIKLNSCEPMEYYGNWLDETGLYEDISLEPGWECDSLTATIQFELVEVDNAVIWQGDSLVATAQNASFQWGVCGAGSSWIPIALSTDSIFLPLNFGYYSVLVEQQGCELRSPCFFWPPPATTGQESSLASRIGLYPNPNSGQINLDLSALSQPADLQVYDARGRWLGGREQVRGQISLDLREFGHGPGLYVIQVRVGEESASLRVVWE